MIWASMVFESAELLTGDLTLLSLDTPLWFETWPDDSFLAFKSLLFAPRKGDCRFLPISSDAFGGAGVLDYAFDML